MAINIKEVKKFGNKILVEAEHALREAERKGLRDTPLYLETKKSIEATRKALEDLPDA